MNDRRVGALVVVVDGQIEGIFTERDILRRVVAECRDPESTTVGQVMTRDLVCATACMSVDQAKAVFREKRIRHLPVVDPDGRPLGLISIGDVNAWAMDNHAVEINYLQEYLYGSRTRGAGYGA
jgi:CBS domain-containing protein